MVAEHQAIGSGEVDRRLGIRAALTRCRQLGAVLAAARLDRITWRAHTLSGLLEEGLLIRAAEMPGADDLMMHRLTLELDALRTEGAVGQAALATALIEREVLTSRGGGDVDAHDRGAPPLPD